MIADQSVGNIRHIGSIVETCLLEPLGHSSEISDTIIGSLRRQDHRRSGTALAPPLTP
jgi:hypothetical protein